MEDSELLGEFLTEAREHLEALEDDILALEDGQPGKDAIHRLFRALHTIKGGSSFLDLPEVTNLSHSLENVVGQMRDGRLVASEDVVAALLGGIDRLRLLVNGSDPGAQGIAGELALLERALATVSGSSSPSGAGAPPPRAEPGAGAEAVRPPPQASPPKGREAPALFAVPPVNVPMTSPFGPG